MTPNLQSINEIEERLGDSLFISPRQIVNLGIYGSLAAVRLALKRGDLPSVKLANHRRRIPKKEFIEYLKENLLTGIEQCKQK